MKQNLYRIYTLSAALLLLSVCVGGCIQEEPVPGGNTATGVTINYSFDDLQTRSIAATPAEKTVNEVYFIFYDVATNAYVAWQRASIPSGSGGTGSFSLPIPESLTTGSKYRTLIVANYDNYKADGKTFDVYIGENRGKSYDEMRRAMRSQSPGRARVVTPLPLYGTLLGADGEESLFTAPDPSSTTPLSVSVRFSRAVSRFDLHNMAADRLRIAWVKVCNYRDAGYFFHQDAPLGDAVVKGTATGVPPTDLNNLPAGYVKADPPVPGTNRQELNKGGLYAYPNIVSYVAQDDEHTTCLLIAGYYTKEGEAPNTTKLTFYRANIADTGLSQVLKRNFVYTVVINSVKKEGAGTEDEAVAEKDRLLDYVVDDQWQDDGGGTVTDDKGNFLTISRTSVILDAPADEAAIVKVSVKEGLSWKLTWRDPAQTVFKYEKIDDTSFRIITLGTNDTEFINTALLNVEATGITPAPVNPLKVTVNVTQLSSKPELKMLTVEGQTGTLDIDVPGQGTTLALQVITGGTTGAWVATPDAALADFIEDTWPQKGGNKGAIVIQFKPNVSNAARTGKLTVTRDPQGGVSPVTINFNQEKSPYRISVFPAYGNGDNKLVVQGFQVEAGTSNGVAREIPFWVTLADPTNYTITVESTFRKDVDAYVAWGSTTPLRTAAYTASTAGETITGGASGAKFTLYVFRTGPGDAPIEGTVFMKAVPKSGSYPAEQISFAVSIETNCGLGDVKIGSLTVADRNCGTPLKHQTPKVGNYTNQANHPDRANDIFKGETFTLDQASQQCTAHGTSNYTGEEAKGWRVPTKTDITTQAQKMMFSKQRVFLLSDDKVAGYIGCWYPLPASGGSYWSNTFANQGAGRYYYMYLLNDRAASTNFVINTAKISLRCVK